MAVHHNTWRSIGWWSCNIFWYNLRSRFRVYSKYYSCQTLEESRKLIWGYSWIVSHGLKWSSLINLLDNLNGRKKMYSKCILLFDHILLNNSYSLKLYWRYDYFTSLSDPGAALVSITTPRWRFCLLFHLKKKKLKIYSIKKG